MKEIRKDEDANSATLPPSASRIPPSDRWRKAISWMCEHGLVPSGYGSLTVKEASE